MGIKAGLFTIVAAGLVVGLSGCGSSDSTAGSSPSSAASSVSSPPASASATSTPPGVASSSATPAAQPVLITIKDFKYTVPASVAPGAKVSVKNEDSVNHTVTSAGAFDVMATTGKTVTFTAPTKPGSYAFVCTFHANMMGTLVVK